MKIFAAANYGHGISRNIYLWLGAMIQAGNIFQGCFELICVGRR
ncbi:MAG TPA: hypothetical protein VHB54_02280 [Mucilaginibacter sp.]|nr:hypothetical protein [Mucilaginibacter sp.]